MEELLKIFKDSAIRSSPLLFLFLTMGYFGKIYIEKQFDVMNTRFNAISSSSLNIKESLRGKELDALLQLRDSIEEWEHELLSSLTNFSTNKITRDSINTFYEKEAKLQLNVKKSIARLGILTRNEAIYLEGQDILITISKLYTPYIGKYLPKIIDLQTEEEPLQMRMKQREALLTSQALNEQNEERILQVAKNDQILYRDINARTVKLMREASDELLKSYPKIVDLLTKLKESMNSHVYRPLISDQINKE